MQNLVFAPTPKTTYFCAWAGVLLGFRAHFREPRRGFGVDFGCVFTPKQPGFWGVFWDKVPNRLIPARAEPPPRGTCLGAPKRPTGSWWCNNTKSHYTALLGSFGLGLFGPNPGPKLRFGGFKEVPFSQQYCPLLGSLLDIRNSSFDRPKPYRKWPIFEENPTFSFKSSKNGLKIGLFGPFVKGPERGCFPPRGLCRSSKS